MVLAIAALCFSPRALFGGSFGIAPVYMQQSDWTYQAIYQSDVEPKRVRAIVAMRVATEQDLVSPVIDVVLYERASGDNGGLTIGTEWRAIAWVNQETSSVLASIRQSYPWPEIDNELLAPHRGPGVTPETRAASDGLEFSKGLFVGDPLFPEIIAQASADDYVAWLEQIGYPAAKLPSEKADEDGDEYRNWQLGRISAAVEHFLAYDNEAVSFALATVVVGPFAPSARVHPDCGLETWTYAPRLVPGSTSCNPVYSYTVTGTAGIPLQTCYVELCIEWHVRVTMWIDTCTNMQGTHTEYRWSTYSNRCCVQGSGPVMPPPSGSPVPALPCVLSRLGLPPDDQSPWTPKPAQHPNGWPYPSFLPPIRPDAPPGYVPPDYTPLGPRPN